MGGTLAADVGILLRSGRWSRPRISTGLILRRCELDEEGIAYWEPPTYIRCVSIDYRNIQMMVRLGPKVSHPTPPITPGLTSTPILRHNPASPVTRSVDAGQRGWGCRAPSGHGGPWRLQSSTRTVRPPRPGST